MFPILGNAFSKTTKTKAKQHPIITLVKEPYQTKKSKRRWEI
jgi:hypothetical protein